MTLSKTHRKHQFTPEQCVQMHSILEEIHEALTDKSKSKGSALKLSQYEIGWLVGIGELLEKIHGTSSQDMQ